MEAIKELINPLVESKINQLGTWQNVRWEGGRVYYESETIKIEISQFNLDIQVYYLERLKQRLIERKTPIQDNLPSSAPDVKNQFLNWIDKYSVILKIQQISDSNSPNSNNNKNPYPEIFTDEGYKLFKYLDENYIRDNKFLRAKYSWIFHFLNDYQMIICTNEMYKDFISVTFKISYSRIQDKQYKFDNTILPLLERKRNDFIQNNKN